MNSFCRYRYVPKSVALLLGLGMFSYRGRELFFCWLYFSLAFAGLVLLVVAGMFLVASREMLLTGQRPAASRAKAPVKVSWVLCLQ